MAVERQASEIEKICSEAGGRGVERLSFPEGAEVAWRGRHDLLPALVRTSSAWSLVVGAVSPEKLLPLVQDLTGGDLGEDRALFCHAFTGVVHLFVKTGDRKAREEITRFATVLQRRGGIILREVGPHRFLTGEAQPATNSHRAWEKALEKVRAAFDPRGIMVG